MARTRVPDFDITDEKLDLFWESDDVFGAPAPAATAVAAGDRAGADEDLTIGMGSAAAALAGDVPAQARVPRFARPAGVRLSPRVAAVAALAVTALLLVVVLRPGHATTRPAAADVARPATPVLRRVAGHAAVLPPAPRAARSWPQAATPQRKPVHHQARPRRTSSEPRHEARIRSGASSPAPPRATPSPAPAPVTTSPPRPAPRPAAPKRHRVSAADREFGL